MEERIGTILSGFGRRGARGEGTFSPDSKGSFPLDKKKPRGGHAR
jgi:hypothetical protein